MRHEAHTDKPLFAMRVVGGGRGSGNPAIAGRGASVQMVR